MPINIPSGFDRATGLGTQPGTVMPPGKLSVNGTAVDTVEKVSIPLQERAGSPEIERAEQATLQHVFTTDWINASNLITFLGRGVRQVDAFGNITRILSTKIKHMAGEETEITITSEGTNFDNPPDEFSCVPNNLGINIIKHPRYLYALLQQKGDSQTIVDFKNDIVNAIQLYIDAPVPPQKSALLRFFTFKTTDPAYQTYAKAAAQEIIQKLWLQFDNPYLAGIQVTWSQYYWRPPFITLGGYVENPILNVNICNPGLPAYFAGINKTDYTEGSIFDQIAVLNPQAYAQPNGNLNISWLREADELEFQRTWMRITRTWIGSPIGNFDPQVYSTFPRPVNWTQNNADPYLLIKQPTS